MPRQPTRPTFFMLFQPIHLSVLPQYLFVREPLQALPCELKLGIHASHIRYQDKYCGLHKWYSFI